MEATMSRNVSFNLNFKENEIIYIPNTAYARDCWHIGFHLNWNTFVELKKIVPPSKRSKGTRNTPTRHQTGGTNRPAMPRHNGEIKHVGRRAFIFGEPRGFHSIAFSVKAKLSPEESSQSGGVFHTRFIARRRSFSILRRGFRIQFSA